MSEPQFIRIHVSLLSVDIAVQRSTDPHRAAKMAGEFDIDKAGTLIVNQRANGQYSVIDGGHRLLAAQLAEYDGELNCLVHQFLPIETEAKLFLALNDSKLVQAIDKFRVRVVAHDEIAISINETLTSHGWRAAPGSTAGNFSAVAALERVSAGAGVLDDNKHHPELVEATLFAITRAWGHEVDGAHGAIVGGLGQLFARYGARVDTKKLVHEMSKRRPVDLVTKARTIKEAQGGNVPAAMAKVLVGIHNTQRRKNLLPEWQWIR